MLHFRPPQWTRPFTFRAVKSESRTRVPGRTEGSADPSWKAIWNWSLNGNKMCLCSAVSEPGLTFSRRKFEDRNSIQGQDTSVPGLPGPSAISTLPKQPVLPAAELPISLYFPLLHRRTLGLWPLHTLWTIPTLAQFISVFFCRFAFRGGPEIWIWITPLSHISTPPTASHVGAASVTRQVTRLCSSNSGCT